MSENVHRIDPPRDFMTGNTRKLQPRPQTILDEHIAVANAARLNLHEDLSRARLAETTAVRVCGPGPASRNSRAAACSAP